jgi:hypothetical protein
MMFGWGRRLVGSSEIQGVSSDCHLTHSIRYSYVANYIRHLHLREPPSRISVGEGPRPRQTIRGRVLNLFGKRTSSSEEATIDSEMRDTIAAFCAFAPNLTNLTELTLHIYDSVTPDDVLCRSLDTLWPLICTKVKKLHLRLTPLVTLDSLAYLGRVFERRILTQLETLTVFITSRADECSSSLTNSFAESFVPLLREHACTLKHVSIVIPANVVPINLTLLFQALPTVVHPAKLTLQSLTLHIPFERRYNSDHRALAAFLSCQQSSLSYLDIAEERPWEGPPMMLNWMSHTFNSDAQTKIALPALRSLRIRNHVSMRSLSSLASATLTSLMLVDIPLTWDDFLELCKTFGHTTRPQGGLKVLRVALERFSVDVVQHLASSFKRLTKLELRYIHVMVTRNGVRINVNPGIEDSTEVSFSDRADGLF